MGGGDWAFGWGRQEENDSIRTIHEALENGVNWIDTAAIYGHGLSEEVVGRALQAWKGGSDVIVATKCGRLPNPHDRPTPRLKRASILKECEDSLRRLGAGVIDLYQMHWPQPDEDIEEGFQAMLDLRAQGKIRWAGVSNFAVSQMERVAKLGHVASLQPPYSLLNREIEREILPWCAAHACGVVVYSPMQCGLLTGKVTQAWVQALPDDDWRKTKSPFFQEPALSRSLSAVSKLKAVAADHGRTVAQLAVAWTLRRPELTAAIVGARRPGQIAEILPAASWELDRETLGRIESVLTQPDE